MAVACHAAADGAVVLVVTNASASHNIAVRRERKLLRQQQPPPSTQPDAVEQQEINHTEPSKEQSGGFQLDEALTLVDGCATRPQLENLLKRASDAQLGALCALLSVRGRRSTESKHRAILSAWDAGFPNYLLLAVDALLAANRQGGHGDMEQVARAVHQDAHLLRGITSTDSRQPRMTTAFNSDGVLLYDLEIVQSLSNGGHGGKLLRFAEPAIQALEQGMSEILRHGDVLALLATPVSAAAASIPAEKDSLLTPGTSQDKLNYEYRVVNRKLGCLVPAGQPDWGLRPAAKRAALQAKGRGAVERYRQQRKQWNDKAAELAKRRDAKLFPTRPHVRTWHGDDVHEGNVEGEPSTRVYEFAGEDVEAESPGRTRPPPGASSKKLKEHPLVAKGLTLKHTSY